MGVQQWMRCAAAYVLYLIIVNVSRSGDSPGSTNEPGAQHDDVIRNIEANQRVYDHIEIRLTETYTHTPPADEREATRFAGLSLIEHSERQLRSVQQPKRLYYENVGNVATFGNEQTRATSFVQGFDGNVTRSVDGDTVNECLGEADKMRALKPHMLPWFDVGGNASSLAEHLSDGFRGELRVSMEVTGSDTVDGIECIMLRRESYSEDTQKDPDVEVIAIAPSRNYCPVKVWSYAYDWSREVPLEIDAMGDWREIEPGVWFPFLVETVVNDESRVRDGLAVPVTTRVLKGVEVKLNPTYGDALFANIPYPATGMVYTMRNGQVVETRRLGAGQLTSDDDKGLAWQSRLMLCITGIVLLAAGVFGWARRAVRRKT